MYVILCSRTKCESLLKWCKPQP